MICRILRTCALAFGLMTPLAVLSPGVQTAAAQMSEAQQAEARAAVEVWLKSVADHDLSKLGEILAPEFQLLRADGSSHGKDSYIASELPVFQTAPQIEDLVVTGSDTLFVARYLVTAQQTRDGGALQTTAPRLSVFRKDGDKWLLVAHANFAALTR